MSVSYRDAEPNGLAALVGGLIEGNLAAYPERSALLRPAVIDLTGRDAEVAISLRFAEGIVEIANGVAGDAHLAGLALMLGYRASFAF